MTATVDLDGPWQLNPQVSLRPEPFGALLYHFGTRRLSFLKSVALVRVVQALADQPSARAACAAAAVPADERAEHERALIQLARTGTITPRAEASS